MCAVEASPRPAKLEQLELATPLPRPTCFALASSNASCRLLVAFVRRQRKMSGGLTDELQAMWSWVWQAVQEFKAATRRGASTRLLDARRGSVAMRRSTASADDWAASVKSMSADRIFPIVVFSCGFFLLSGTSTRW